MEQTLQGVQGVVCYLDDLLITGRSPQEHWNRVEEVPRRLDDWGFKSKKKKCHFFNLLWNTWDTELMQKGCMLP